MGELKLKKSLIVTGRESEDIETDKGEIRIIPAWEFLLDFDLSKMGGKKKGIPCGMPLEQFSLTIHEFLLTITA
jgi:hypothetical protein